MKFLKPQPIQAARNHLIKRRSNLINAAETSSNKKGILIALNHGRRMIALLSAMLCMPALAENNETVNLKDLTEMPLEQLMNIEVTSVSRTPQTVSQSAAAVYVITQEDIRRSGATTIAEALRMAPGLNVARLDANKWAISSRGFNDFFANKLLVLQDGRSVYTPLFSGVFWDVQDTLLEDIERIEVIRGPGAALWGANAVNGVINIITKSSANTQGGLVTGGAGTEMLGFGGVRYGGKFSDDASYRVYARYFNHDDFVDAAGRDGADAWDMFRGGFRSDWKVSETDIFTFQGDYYDGKVGQRLNVFSPPAFFRTIQGDGDVSGGNLVTSWKHTFSETSDMGLQLYYDRTEREDLIHEERRNTYNVDFQHRFGLGQRQQVIWGLGYRLSEDRIGPGRDPGNSILFDPEEQSDHLYSAFVQDGITLVEDRLRLIVGSKFEHNDYTGVEIQPNSRIVWTPTEKHSLWAAVSRAVRTPSRFEHSIDAWVIPPPAKLVGNTDYESENLIAYEAGYRYQPVQRLSLDLAVFYNEYDDLRVIAPFGTRQVFPSPFPPVAFFIPENGMDGETYGTEFSGTWNVTEAWKINAGYSWLQMQLHADRGSLPGSEVAEGDSPHHQFHLRSYMDLPHRLEFDTAVYYVDAVPNQSVSSYIRLDARLGWRPTRDLEFSLGVQNILDNQHSEFGPGFLVSPTEVERSAYAKVTWRF